MKKHILFFGLLTIMTFHACVDQEFDVPPGLQVQEDDISNLTIAELKALHSIGGPAVAIPEGTIIKGTVVSDDETGNFFKDLVIQDGTSGIHIRADQNNLSSIYPRGREVFIDCTDLFLGEFNGLVQIGVQSTDPQNVDRLPEVMVGQRIILGTQGDEPVGTPRTIANLQASDVSTLVTLQGVEIDDDDLGETYAQSGGGGTQNRRVVDCEGNEITLRNSDFSSFAGVSMPGGNGTLTGVFSVFGNTFQFTIRDTDDADMFDPRCDGTGGGGAGSDDDIQEEDISNLSIADLKAMHSIGADAVKVPAGTIIKGHVISSDETGNFFKNLYIQDETGGIQIRVDVNDLYLDYDLGRLMYIDCNDLFIGDFNGLPQLGAQGDGSGVNRISANAATSILIRGPLESVPEPATRTISSLSNADLNTWVTIEGLQYEDALLGDTYAVPDGGFAQNRILNDCDGNTLIIRNSDFADWAGTPIPDGNGRITAVFAVFGADFQLFINTPDDVEFTGSRCDGTGGGGGDGDGDAIDEDFQAGNDFDPVNLDGWTNVSTTGVNVWTKNSFNGNGFAQATGFQASDAEVDSWLVTPEIDLSETSMLSFESAVAFYVQDGLSVHFSEDFNGDVNSATWTDVPCTLAGATNENFEWVESGMIDLNTLATSNGHIAFRYRGDNTSNTSTFRIDNVLVQ